MRSETQCDESQVTLQLDTFGNGLSMGLHPAPHTGRDIDQVGVIVLGESNHQRGVAVVTSVEAALLEILLHPGDIPQVHVGAVGALAQDGVQDRLDRLVVSRRAKRRLTFGPGEGARRKVEIVSPNAPDDVDQGQVVARGLVPVDDHAYLPFVLASHRCRAHAGQVVEPLLDVARDLEKRHLPQLGCVGHDHHQDGVGLPDGELPDVRILCIGRQIVHAFDGGAQVVDRRLVLRVCQRLLPFDEDRRVVGPRLGGHLLDVRDLADLLLDLGGDESLDLLRRRATPDRADHAGVEGDVGEEVDGEAREADEARHHADHEQQVHQDGLPDAEAGEAHESSPATLTRCPSRSSRTPLTATRSPSPSPSITSIRPGRNGTGRVFTRRRRTTAAARIPLEHEQVIELELALQCAAGNPDGGTGIPDAKADLPEHAGQKAPVRVGHVGLDRVLPGPLVRRVAHLGDRAGERLLGEDIDPKAHRIADPKRHHLAVGDTELHLDLGEIEELDHRLAGLQVGTRLQVEGVDDTGEGGGDGGLPEPGASVGEGRARVQHRGVAGALLVRGAVQLSLAGDVALGEAALPLEIGHGEPVGGLRTQQLSAGALHGRLQEGPLDLDHHGACLDPLVLLGIHRDHLPADLRRDHHRADRRQDRRELRGDVRDLADCEMSLDREHGPGRCRARQGGLRRLASGRPRCIASLPARDRIGRSPEHQHRPEQGDRRQHQHDHRHGLPAHRVPSASCVGPLVQATAQQLQQRVEGTRGIDARLVEAGAAQQSVEDSLEKQADLGGIDIGAKLACARTGLDQPLEIALALAVEGLAGLEQTPAGFGISCNHSRCLVVQRVQALRKAGDAFHDQHPEHVLHRSDRIVQVRIHGGRDLVP